jgi:VCBS repeat-containing protein
MTGGTVSGRVLRLTLGVATVIALTVAALTPAAVAGAGFAAKASIATTPQYVGDSVGTTFSLSVTNTGTVRPIGAVRISRPSTFWTVSACPSAPTGWTKTRKAGSCTYKSMTGSADDIHRGATGTFTFVAKTAAANANRSGSWSVIVSTHNNFSDVSWLKNAVAKKPGLKTTAYSFEVTDVVVASAPATAGTPCPAAARSAHANSTGNVLVVCGTNHTNVAQTARQAYSSISGTFVASAGSFSAGAVGAGATNVVLGNWNDVQVPGAASSLTVQAKIGAYAQRTSPQFLATDFATGNTAPSAADDSCQVDEDTACVGNVLVNDSDADVDEITVAHASADNSTFLGPDGSGVITFLTDHGTVSLYTQSFMSHVPGDYTYTPDPNWSGTDQFYYTVTDGTTESSAAKVSITVDPVNDAPVAANDSYVTNEDTPLTIAAPGVLGNDMDADGNPIHVSAIVVGPAHGSLVMNVDGSFQYTPDSNFNGPDSFTYKNNDGTADSNVATVNVTVNSVNDAPVASDDEYTTYVGGFSFTEPNGLRTNVTDADGDTQTISKVSDPSTGTLTVNSDGSFSYNAPSLGDYTFTWKSNDGTADSNTATFTIHVISSGGGGGGGGGGCLKVC